MAVEQASHGIVRAGDAWRGGRFGLVASESGLEFRVLCKRNQRENDARRRKRGRRRTRKKKEKEKRKKKEE